MDVVHLDLHHLHEVIFLILANMEEASCQNLFYNIHHIYWERKLNNFQIAFLLISKRKYDGKDI